MGLVITAQPASEPLTLAEATEHLRYEESDEDVWINRAIKSARKHAEMFTRRQFVTATYSWTLDKFPASSGTLFVPRPPLISIGSLQYVDTDGATQSLTVTTDYLLDITSEPGRITPAYETTWPGTRAVIDAVTIVFDAGYGVASAVPETIKSAMLLMIGHWFENRESVVVGVRLSLSELPQGVKELLWGERLLEI